MDFSKVAGWILLIAGIAIIGWTLMSSYNIFTTKEAVPEFFEIPKEEVVSLKAGTQDIQAQLQKMIGEQLKGILPADSITKLLNLAVWSMLAFILIFGGAQISSLGIKLIKK
jgi:hypothetical protein